MTLSKGEKALENRSLCYYLLCFYNRSASGFTPVSSVPRGLMCCLDWLELEAPFVPVLSPSWWCLWLLSSLSGEGAGTYRSASRCSCGHLRDVF